VINLYIVRNYDVLLKLTTDRHEASRRLFVTAELLVVIQMKMSITKLLSVIISSHQY